MALPHKSIFSQSQHNCNSDQAIHLLVCSYVRHLPMHLSHTTPVMSDTHTPVSMAVLLLGRQLHYVARIYNGIVTVVAMVTIAINYYRCGIFNNAVLLFGIFFNNIFVICSLYIGL